jgi:hypothetical protein
MNKPKPIIASDTLKSATKYEWWLLAGNTQGSRNDSSKVNDIKHYNALPYFEGCKFHSTILPKFQFQYIISTCKVNYQRMHCRILN